MFNDFFVVVFLFIIVPGGDKHYCDYSERYFPERKKK